MTGNTVIFVTDNRQKYVGDYLPGKKKQFDFKCVVPEEKLREIIQDSETFVLPTPVSKMVKYPNILDILKEELTRKEVGRKKLYGGAFSDEWVCFMKQENIWYADFMQMEEVAEQNAKITAEATIAEILKYSQYSIEGQKMIVTGYGRCGREIAGLLHLMGAKVTVLARSSKARKQAICDGLEATDFSYGPEEVYGTRTVINTVPSLVIRESMLKEMHADAVIIDIASRPGGVDLSAAERYEVQVIPALGLPGIYTTKSSAVVLSNAIRKMENGNVCEGEEKSWIYQILI